MNIDVSKTIAPKSDQMNADDLIAGPQTITITAVKSIGGDKDAQPIAIHYQGDDGKPYKPCKSMRRVLVHAWGSEGADYVGRQLTLFNDPSVTFGGAAVGGIRISHMSHIDREQIISLTVSRANRRPYKIQKLEAAPMQIEGDINVDDTLTELGEAADLGIDTFKNAWEATWRAASNGERALLMPRLEGLKERANAANEDMPT